MNFNIDKDLQNCLELGTPVIIFGISKDDNLEFLKESLKYRNLKLNVLGSASSETETNEFNQFGITLRTVSSEFSQEQILKSSLRQDPDGFILTSLETKNAPIFVTALVSGVTFGTTAIVAEKDIISLVKGWLSQNITDAILNEVFQKLVFINVSKPEVKTFEAQVLNGDIKVNTYNHIFQEIQKPAPYELKATREEDLILLKNRSESPIFEILKNVKKSAWVPVTKKLDLDLKVKLDKYLKDLRPMSLVAQIDADDLPSHLKAYLGSDHILQIMTEVDKWPRDFKFHVITKNDFIKNYPPKLPITIFREEFYLEKIVQLDDYPRLEDSILLQQNADYSDGAYDDEVLTVDFNKFSGWPFWLQGTETPKDRPELFFQISSQKNEYDLYLGANWITYIFFDPKNKNSWSVIEQCG